MTVTMYPDWYLVFCAIVVVMTLVILGIATWRHKP